MSEKNVLYDYFDKDELLKIFPDTILNYFELMCKLDPNDLINQMQDLMKHRHKLIEISSILSYKISKLSKKLKIIEKKVITDAYATSNIKINNKDDKQLIIESSKDWISQKIEIDNLTIQLDFVQKVSSLLESKHYMIKNYIDFLMWSKGDK